MTQPTAHGYPDWNRVSAQADAVFFDVSNNVINAAQSHDVGFVGNYPACGVLFRADTNHFNVEFDFYQDAARTQFIDNYEVSVRQGLTFNRNIPILGPYLQVVVTPSAAASQYDIRLWAAPNFAISTAIGSISPVLISQTQTNVAAGATSTITAARVSPGEAHVTFMTSATNWFAYVDAIDDAGVVTTIDTFGGPTFETIHHRIFLPPQTIRTRFINNDAGAQDYWMYLVARPMYAGA